MLLNHLHIIISLVIVFTVTIASFTLIIMLLIRRLLPVVRIFIITPLLLFAYMCLRVVYI